MKKLLSLSAASLLAIAVSTPAMAGGCAWGSHASADTSKVASSDQVKVEEAMTTFDPKVLDDKDKSEEIKPVESE